MQTVDALKAVYEAIGGDPDDVADITLIPDMIAAIAEALADGTAAELPKVTATDNGRVLKVIDGEWGVGTDATE